MERSVFSPSAAAIHGLVGALLAGSTYPQNNSIEKPGNKKWTPCVKG